MKNQNNLHNKKLIFPAVSQITCNIKIANLQAAKTIAKILKYMYQMVVNSV